ncbi:MAG: phosphatase PAP2 family protein [Solirubrobacterales bacterium]
MLRQLAGTAHGRLLVGAGVVVALVEVSVVTRLELELARAIHGSTVGWLTDVVFGLTELGGTMTVLLLTAVAVAALIALRHWRGAVALAVAVLGTQMVVALAKGIVSRPRPAEEMAVTDPSGWSFPSAHSASAVALYVMLALIATSLWRGRLRPGVAFAAAGTVVALVGLSRIYLGAHYPTDVLAGWLTGGLVVAGSWAACSRLPAPQLRPIG